MPCLHSPRIPGEAQCPGGSKRAGKTYLFPVGGTFLVVVIGLLQVLQFVLEQINGIATKARRKALVEWQTDNLCIKMKTITA